MSVFPIMFPPIAAVRVGMFRELSVLIRDNYIYRKRWPALWKHHQVVVNSITRDCLGVPLDELEYDGGDGEIWASLIQSVSPGVNRSHLFHICLQVLLFSESSNMDKLFFFVITDVALKSSSGTRMYTYCRRVLKWLAQSMNAAHLTNDI